MFRLLLLCILLPLGAAADTPFAIPPATAAKIGQRLWNNECSGTVAGLTSWNAGEDFASLGIGHFIWYPKGPRGPYEESFPGLVSHLAARGAPVPQWLSKARHCPWSDRAAFLAAKNSPQLKELRTLLATTVPLQAEFAAQRSTASLPKILAAAPAGERDAIRARFLALTQTGSGLYCLMDYVNFKGEGTNPAERYKGHGWGLLQVLQAIPGQPSPQQAPAAFAAAAKGTLGRRIELAPKKESQWREGWFNRCDSYARGL
jgi:hypothetical protein